MIAGLQDMQGTADQKEKATWDAVGAMIAIVLPPKKDSYTLPERSSVN